MYKAKGVFLCLSFPLFFKSHPAIIREGTCCVLRCVLGDETPNDEAPSVATTGTDQRPNEPTALMIFTFRMSFYCFLSAIGFVSTVLVFVGQKFLLHTSICQLLIYIEPPASLYTMFYFLFFCKLADCHVYFFCLPSRHDRIAATLT